MDVSISERLTTETSYTDDPDGLTWSGTVTDKRGEHGETSAEHRRGVFRLERFGDGEDESTVCADHLGISALRHDIVG